MKKKVVFLLSSILLVGALTGCGNINTKAGAETAPVVITKQAESGSFTVYDYGKIKLHAYATNDPLADEAFIVESPDALIGIELPSFTKDLDTWKNYIAGLNKPMNDIFIADHPAGASYVKNMNVYGTETAKESIENGAAAAITQGLYQAFGNSFHGGDDVVKINKVVPEGKVTVGGVEFNIINNGYSYDIEIPALNVIHTHMLGKDVHSIMVSFENMDYMVNILEGYQKAGYSMILSSHYVPEGQDAVTEKIAYIKTVKEFAEKYSDKQEFIDAVKKQFPNYSGENYLEMTAGYLYQK